MKTITIKICFLALVFTVALCPWALAQTPTQFQYQGQAQEQTQNQGIYNDIGGQSVNISSTSRNYTLPYQLYPPALAPDFGNGNTYGNFVKVPAAFSLKHRFTRCELETMLPSHGLWGGTSGISVKFRSWAGPRVGVKNPNDYVDFIWELPRKQAVGPDGRPKLDEKGQIATATYVPDSWCTLGTGTAGVTNGDADTYSLIAQYGLFCLDTGKCNKVFLVGEGIKTFIQAYGWNVSFGYTQAYVSGSGEQSGVGGVGVGFAYAKTGRLADPWLQGHFIYDSAAEPAE